MCRLHPPSVLGSPPQAFENIFKFVIVTSVCGGMPTANPRPFSRRAVTSFCICSTVHGSCFRKTRISNPSLGFHIQKSL